MVETLSEAFEDKLKNHGRFIFEIIAMNITDTFDHIIEL